MVIIRACRLRS